MPVELTQRPRRTDNSPSSSLVIRNVVVSGHRTSVRLEPAMWDALHDIARHLGASIHGVVSDIDDRRTASSLTAAIRVYIVDFYRAVALLGGQSRALQPIPLRFGNPAAAFLNQPRPENGATPQPERRASQRHRRSGAAGSA